jgi:hypothetical protein
MRTRRRNRHLSPQAAAGRPSAAVAFGAVVAAALGAWLVALAAPRPALAARTFYVDGTNGSENNAGTSTAPFKTVSRAATVANMPGDVVYIRGGVYHNDNFQNVIHPDAGGTAAEWITFRAYPGELPILDGSMITSSGGSGFEPPPGATPVSYVRVVGIVARNFPSSGFSNGWDRHASNLHFQNVIAEGNGINGITFYGTGGVIIENSIVAHNGNRQPSWSSGVNLYAVTGSYLTNIVRGNVSFENVDISSNHSDGSGFILDFGSTGALFENNIGFRNGGSCIRLTNSPGSRLVGNTCYRNGLDTTAMYRDEIYYSDPASRGSAVLRNNLVAPGSGLRALNDASGVSSMNNLTLGSNDATPFFMNAGAADFRIAAGSTTVIDRGVATDAPASDIGFDPRCIRAQTGQAISWWQNAPDYDYIRSVGGVAGCFRPAVRVQGAAPDVGAYETGGMLVAATGGASGSGGRAGSGGATGAGGAGGRAGTGGGAAGASGTGGATVGSGGAASGTGGATAGSGGSIGGGTGGTTGTPGSGGGAAADAGTTPPAGEPGACGCHLTGGAGSGGIAAAAVFLITAMWRGGRRRRCRCR